LWSLLSLGSTRQLSVQTRTRVTAQTGHSQSHSAQPHGHTATAFDIPRILLTSSTRAAFACHAPALASALSSHMLAHATQYTNRLHAANACPPKQVHPGLSARGTELKCKVLHIPNLSSDLRGCTSCTQSRQVLGHDHIWRFAGARNSRRPPPPVPVPGRQQHHRLLCSAHGMTLQASRTRRGHSAPTTSAWRLCYMLLGTSWARPSSHTSSGQRPKNLEPTRHRLHPRGAPGLTYTWGPAHGA